MADKMTEQEAKEYLECIVYEDFAPYTQKAVLVAINALEEIQQYRAIGTVEECRVRHKIPEGREFSHEIKRGFKQIHQ